MPHRKPGAEPATETILKKIAYRRTNHFPLMISSIIVTGMCSALIDATLGWETLVLQIIAHAAQ